MSRFQVGDRVKANANNEYIALTDQNIEVGTTGTIREVDVMEGEPDFYLVDFDAEWVGVTGGTLSAPDDHPIIYCYDDELEAAE